MQMHMLSLFLWFSRCTIRNRKPYIWRYSILRLSFTWNFLAVLLYLNLEREVPKSHKICDCGIKIFNVCYWVFCNLNNVIRYWIHQKHIKSAIMQIIWWQIYDCSNKTKMRIHICPSFEVIQPKSFFHKQKKTTETVKK